MSIITLVSGGLDSTLMAILSHEEGIDQFPLFIDYGQINRSMEYRACRHNFKRFNLPKPNIITINGYGKLISSGLTDNAKHIYNDAFLPCRNLMFLTVGAAYAYQCDANAVAIGLLDEKFSIFPDQTKEFVIEAEKLISTSLDRNIKILTPLMGFTKSDVVHVSKSKGISNTYSCHAGTKEPCGKCIACREYIGLEV